MAGAAQARIAADVGGTFTDVAVFDGGTGRLALGKHLTTTERIVDGIDAGVAKAGARFAASSLFLHGTTVAINAMLERTGARTALVTTRGFRDVYESAASTAPSRTTSSSASTGRSSSARCASR